MQEYNIDKAGAGVADLWETRVLGIEGMTCDNCVKTLTRALKRLNGIKDVQVDRENARATITFDTTKTDMAAIHETIEKSGYKATLEIRNEGNGPKKPAPEVDSSARSKLR